MNRNWIRTTLIAATAAAALFAAGCARKSATTTPTPAPTPPSAPSTPTTPAPTPPAPAPTPAPTPAPAQMEDVFYAFDSAALDDGSRAVLDRNAKWLRDHSGARVTIEGHCDERGTTKYNLDLGEKRANAARDYLVAAGIDGGRLSVISYGKERPFADGHDEAAWAQNRRAHFVTQ